MAAAASTGKADYSALAAAGLREAWQQVLAHTVAAPGGCLNHTFASGKEYGQVRFQKVKYYCHVLAAMVSTGEVPDGIKEASHLCGNPACVRPEHLCFDPDGLYNKTRGCCQMFLGTHSAYVCPHEPQCIITGQAAAPAAAAAHKRPRK